MSLNQNSSPTLGSLGALQILTGAFANGTAGGQAMAANLGGRFNQAADRALLPAPNSSSPSGGQSGTSATSETQLREAIENHAKFIELQKKVSSVSEKVDKHSQELTDQSKKIDNVSSASVKTLTILEALEGKIDNINASTFSHINAAREEAKALAAAHRPSPGSKSGLATSALEASSILLPSSTEGSTPPASLTNFDHLSLKWRKGFRFVDTITINEDIHTKSFASSSRSLQTMIASISHTRVRLGSLRNGRASCLVPCRLRTGSASFPGVT